MAKVNRRPLEWTREEVKMALEVYNKNDLYYNFIQPVIQLLVKHRSAIAAHLQKAEQDILNSLADLKTTKPKDYLLDVASLLFLNPETFRFYWDNLTPEAQKVLEYTAFRGTTPYWVLEKDLGIKTYEKHIDRKQYWSGGPVYEIEKIRVLPAFSRLPYLVPASHSYGYSTRLNQLVFDLKNELALLVAYRIAELKNYDLNPLPKLEDSSLFRLNAEEEVLRAIPALLIYLHDKKPKTSAKGRPYIAAIKGLQKRLAMREFFPDTTEKKLAYLRANKMLSLVLQLPEMPLNMEPQEFVKHLFTKIYTQAFRTAMHLLTHLDKMSYLKKHDFVAEEEYLFTELQVLAAQHSDWIRIEEWERELSLKPYRLDFIHYYARDKLHFVIPGEHFGEQYDVDLNVRPYLNSHLLIWPAIKSTIFLFAAWGLVEIAYQPVDYSVPGITACSPYDGLTAFRFTKLGRYVLGVDAAFQGRVQQAFQLSLATDSLSILLDEGEMELAARAIASFAQPVGKSRFQTNADMFLQACKTSADLQTKINLFKSLFFNGLPPNWAAFFKELSNKTNPLKLIEGWKVFELSPDDGQLLQLVARHPDFKDLCVKAEGHRILVQKKDLPKLRTLLRKNGYLVE